MTVELKPCPFCGKQPLHTVLRPRASTEIHRYECDCGFSRTAYTNSEEKSATLWNRRAPEPVTKMLSNDDIAQDMAECIFTCNWESIDELKSYIVSFLNEVESKKSEKSVIRWTRYDGTPETLPKERESVLFHGVEYGYEVVMLKKCPALIWLHFSYSTEMMEHFKCIDEGDLWAYLPEPPEGME